MDRETAASLEESLRHWCAGHAAQLEAFEHGPQPKSAYDDLFSQLQALGITEILGLAETQDELGLVAVTARVLTEYSPGVALLVVARNLAARLLHETGQTIPSGWIALPLYDSAADWHYEGRVHPGGRDACVSGHWSLLASLPVAEHVLLPMYTESGVFVLLSLPTPPGCETVMVMGLRGCPNGDLALEQATVEAGQLLGRGQAGLEGIAQALWSQAELCMMAIRAGILVGGYQSAHAYANQRWQGGKMIAEHSIVQQMLGNLQRECSCLESDWRRIAADMQPGLRVLSADGMARALRSAERLPWLASDCIQLLGGNGYMEDFVQARRMRDAKQSEFLLGHPQQKAFALSAQAAA